MDDRNYQKCKNKVKIWEKTFKKQYGRIPSKHDIHEADIEIREAYKIYFKIKTAVLEETLHDIDFDEPNSEEVNTRNGNESPDISEIESTLSELINAPNNQDSNFDIGLLKTCNNQHASQSVQDEKITSVDNSNGKMDQTNVWGSHLNKSKLETKQAIPSKKFMANASFSQKLFKNSSFSMRNPRKSLSSSSFNKSSSDLTISSSQPTIRNTSDDILPDIDNILKMQAESQPDKFINNTFQYEGKMAKPFRAINQGWLDRCNLKNSFNKTKENDSGFDSLESSLNMNENSLDKTSNVNSNNINTNINQIHATKQPTYGLSNLDFSNYKQPDVSVQNIYNTSEHLSDSDGIVANSESETETPNKSVRHVLKKRKLTQTTTMRRKESSILCNGMTTSSSANYNKFINKNTASNVANPILSRSTTGNMKLPPKIPNEEEKLPPIVNEKTDYNVNDITNFTLKQNKSQNVDHTSKQKSSISQNRPIRTTRNTKVVNYITEKSDDPFASDNDYDNDPDFEAEPKKENDLTDDGLINDTVNEKTKRKKPIKPKKVTDETKSKKKITNKTPKLSFTSRITRARRVKGKKTLEVEESVDAKEEYEIEFLNDVNTHIVPRLAVGDINAEEDLVDQYAFALGTSDKNIPLAVKPKKTKTQANAKEKLKKKIEAGSLNENFVTINMKKKVFVRGKKTHNFSKYKKSLWKQKKAAALSGPDMDMGGCDGGVLTCYKCDQIGHFGRQCTAKGDRLLPLEADEEISPFPTLEEAAKMANQTVLSVHANRIDKIPLATNITLQQDSGREEGNTVEVIQKEPSINASVIDSSSNAGENNSGEKQNNHQQNDTTEEPVNNWKRHSIPEEFLRELSNSADDKEPISPLYNLKPDGSLIETPKEVLSILQMFGHKSFRPGQERAIMRILSGQSTLVTLSTGSGKSLCYQLPAYLYAQSRPCITLVISPLVSLMEDQVTGVPDFLNATCLHTNQTSDQREKILQAVQSGIVNILLISPEAVVSGEKRTGFGSLLKKLPPIAFACIDEAHCVSQWSHNFRPSYLMICRVLREKLGVKTVLGLTATATRQTRESIVTHLQVPDGLNGIISDVPLPDNLILTVSKDPNRDRALVNLLKGERFASLNSIIVYCTRREECERIAGFIRTCFQDNLAPEGTKKRKRICWNAEPYHAGMASSRRKTVQKAFMCGDLRIVVATVAFGMGINKSDIRAVIHYNMPKNFESYVQEVGRAGRDGLSAHCHLFLDSKGGDQNELRRHIYSNSIDRHVIRKLLQRVFVACKCTPKQLNSKGGEVSDVQKEIESISQLDWSDISGASQDKQKIKETIDKRSCPGHEVAFSIADTVAALDIPEENISTLLCYLELHNERYINVLSSAYIKCKITSYGGPKQLRIAAQTCPPLAMAIALDLKQGIKHETTSTMEFAVIDIAAAIGWDSGVVKYQLKNLEWTSVNGAPKRSPINVEFMDLGFRVRAPGDLSDKELDETLDLLYERVTTQESTALLQLQSVFDAMHLVAYKTCFDCETKNISSENSDNLKRIIREYFQRENFLEETLRQEENTVMEGQIISDVCAMVNNYPENNFTGRSLARIFHGIQSPNYPAVIWGRCRYWRAHLHENFHTLVKIANREIIKMK